MRASPRVYPRIIYYPSHIISASLTFCSHSIFLLLYLHSVIIQITYTMFSFCPSFTIVAPTTFFIELRNT
ncbi:hypothetical protein BDR04DRAFT_1096867 [Suillus decipiens]|nr:hypothetical protein BDR04DRAFT_1096867 [Suillus decipiens]